MPSRVHKLKKGGDYMNIIAEVNKVVLPFAIILISIVIVQATLFLHNALMFNKKHQMFSKEEIQDAMKSGVLAGFPCVDLKVNLVFGSYHEVDSSEQAFYVAGSMAIKDAMQKAGPVLLEPIMDVEVVTPEEYLGDVMGDLNGRRGRVQSMEARAGGAQSVRAQVPLASMFGYATDLRSRTQGRATFTMQFDHYERVPQAIADEIQKSKN